MFPLSTLKEFIDNPMGKGSTAIPNRQLLKDDYNRRFIALKKRKKFEYTVYRDGDEYYFHVSVPSETERSNTYDVVLHFTMDEENLKYDNFLNRYRVKFFSNCPSFTYSFAFVFYQNGLLINDLLNKYKDEIMDKLPIIRNPGEVITYEKSTMFACLFVSDSFILKNKMYLNQLAKPFDLATFNKAIRTTDTIELEIKKGDNILTERKKKEETELKEKMKVKTSRSTITTTKKRIGGNVIKGKPKIEPKKKIKYMKSSTEYNNK